MKRTQYSPSPHCCPSCPPPSRTRNSGRGSYSIPLNRPTPSRRSSTKSDPSPTKSNRSSRANRSSPTLSRSRRRHSKPTTSQAAVQPLPPDDPCAEDALFTISLADFGPATAATDLEYLRQFGGLAQFREHWKWSRSRLPTSERSSHQQHDSGLRQFQHLPGSNRLPHRAPPSISTIL